MSHEPDFDAVTGQSTTGHSWDGIRELNTPLPRWWLWTFYVTILWSIGYWLVYPAWPLISSHTTGFFGYSSRAAVTVEVQALEQRRDQQAAGLKTASLEEIKASPDLLRVALARGKASFAENCVGCHGQGGTGAPSYPNLTDDDWVWGGALKDIQTTIQHGIRWTQNADTRVGEMLAFGRQGMLKKDEIEQVVDFVRSLAKLEPAKGADLAAGKAVYDANCAACHGEAGKGNREVGAPDLTDAIWLYGSSREAMIESVHNGRAGIMPAWSSRLDPVTIKALTVYVHSLGGGQ
ncbi:cytochrome-c oxidase, cbb3-type subunit III [Rhabdaerophilum sp. SD176]|uniref:cytochrome-c oxidase, cbb3-type subunit III n=1 Tax=Rhabdaerophilum sp. SD176 TaxID=2983548 RepID=UPI0024DFC39E|nr:cytochrome-c oxidase, cbb3-type subunit III [Rhabdaerophilum sp. SD176]